jgi:hypothetical protein
MFNQIFQRRKMKMLCQVCGSDRVHQVETPGEDETFDESIVKSFLCAKCEQMFFVSQRCGCIISDLDDVMGFESERECPICGMSHKKMSCPVCHTENWNNETVCPNCKTEHQIVECPHCEKEIIYSKELENCPFCGDYIGENEFTLVTCAHHAKIINKEHKELICQICHLQSAPCANCSELIVSNEPIEVDPTYGEILCKLCKEAIVEYKDD